MESILRDLPHVCFYLDDILVTGESEGAHMHNIATVLNHLESTGIHLKWEKCAFMLPEVEYLGHRISARGLQPLASKVKAITQTPTPTNVSQLKSFIVILNYYGPFLLDLTNPSSSLVRAPSINSEVELGQESKLSLQTGQKGTHNVFTADTLRP